MASRRLLSSSLQRTNFRLFPSPLSCASLPSSPRENEQAHCYLPHFNSIRSFSAIAEEEKKQSYRDRARDGARKGAKVARKGAKVARQGATTASEMIRQYGPVFVGTYFSLYLFSWSAIFCGMDSGLLDPVQIMGWISGGAEESKSTVHMIVEYMEKYEFTKPYASTVEKNPHIANLGVAWVANKFTEPLRLMVTLGIVPRLARHFGFVHPKQDEASVEESTEEKEAGEMTVEEKVSESTTKRQ